MPKGLDVCRDFIHMRLRVLTPVIYNALEMRGGVTTQRLMTRD